ncbi:hypothetical protein PIB30_101368 [Stylosanthes scabra]|uniref:Uncharacterized protein n=1 Tax=Stylosanthes scabra TaxID=79078 RepID=A0ABU6WVM2_9FABA|nr:hypothetical protein [Stylosanthes scabra]
MTIIMWDKESRELIGKTVEELKKNRIAGDETPISLHNDSLITVYEVSDEWVYYNSEPGRIYYAYSLNNVLRKTLLRDEANFNVQDVFDYSDSLYFSEI